MSFDQVRAVKRRAVSVAAVLGVAVFALVAFPARASAQVAAPADQAREEEERLEKAAEAASHRPTYLLPPVEVVGQALPRLREEQRVGDYRQPRWTARRRFTETRVYVMTPGQFDFEYWLVPTFNRDDTRDVKKQYEVEMGLPARFQVDLYMVSHKTGQEGPLAFDEEKFELRWALANWGVIPANPTLYAEWASENQAADHFEGKLLLGGELGSGWHWGANLVWEHEMGGPQENSRELTSGISRTVVDDKFSLGLEEKLALVDTKANRGHPSRELLLGPSLQFRPLPQMHIDLNGFIGMRHDAPRAEPMLILGWEF